MFTSWHSLQPPEEVFLAVCFVLTLQYSSNCPPAWFPSCPQPQVADPEMLTMMELFSNPAFA
jgi:hypothetical protein